MVIDSSAIVAIALNEPDAEALERKIVDAPLRLMSAASLLALTMVIETRLGEAAPMSSICGCIGPVSRSRRSM